MQNRVCDIGWSDVKKCRGCNKEEGTGKHWFSFGPPWREVRNQIPEGAGRTQKLKRRIGSGEEALRGMKKQRN